MLQNHTLVVGPLQCNCVILACEKSKEAIIIDPGEEASRIISKVEENQLKVKYVLHTHAHFDHIGATSGVCAFTQAPSCLHQGDLEIYQNLTLQGKMFGFKFESAPGVKRFLEGDEELVFGEHRIQVIHTPGHSPGSVCFRLLTGNEALFSGDTLFRQSIGRTDLWGGDHSQLIRSIKDRLLVLDSDLPVHPGHGPSTHIGIEKAKNPFLN